MEKRYKEIDGVRYQVIQNTILGSNVIPVGESLPEVTVSDSGKVLGVNSSGEWVPVDAPSDLPDIAGNAGKVLTVNSGATGTEWADAPTELPEVTSADAGDVLTVNASGEWEAAAPGGGGGLTLYGPYLAVPASGVTVAANEYKVISLTKIMNEATENNVILPDDPFIAFLIGGFVQNGNMYLKGVDAPIYYDSTFTSDASIAVENHDTNSQTIEEGKAGVRFFCSVELQPATP